jgi:hypothetical protein
MMTDHLPWLGRILEVYLKHGADLFLEFSVEKVPGAAAQGPIRQQAEAATSEAGSMSDWDLSMDEENERDWIFRMTVGEDRRQLQLRYSDVDWRRQLVDRTKECQAGSLSDFIKMYRFPNESQLLRLIERRMRTSVGRDERAVKIEGKMMARSILVPVDEPMIHPKPISFRWLFFSCMVGILVAVMASHILRWFWVD